MKTRFLFLFLFVFASFFYFYNFKQRIVFGPEQGLSLLVSADYINKDFSLLGLPNVRRVTDSGHMLFSGSLFNYVLVPQLLLFNYDPVILTLLNALFIFLTSVLTTIVAYKLYGKKTGFFVGIFMFFNALMIYHATFIWILNALPLIGLATFILITKLKNHWAAVLLIGILSGIGFNLQYMYIFTAVPLFFYLLYISKKRFRNSLLFVLGAIIGNFPMVLFDIRNDFYHLRTLIEYFFNTTQKPEQSSISYYHFLQLLPVFAIAFGYGLSKIKSKVLISFLVCMYFLLNFKSDFFNLNSAVNMPSGMTYDDYNEAAQLISNNLPEKFNVTSLLEKDSPRAYPLRYLLTYKYKNNPMDIEQYQESDTLYVLAREDIFLKSNQYEVASFDKGTAQSIGEVGDGIKVIKLSK